MTRDHSETYVYTCRSEYRIPSGCIPDICRPGRNDDAVAYWSAYFDDSQVTPEAIKAELKECGAWSDDELRDDEQNRYRFLWVLAWAAHEQGPDSDDGCIVRRIHR